MAEIPSEITAGGKKLGLRELLPSQTLDLLEAAGQANCANPGWVLMAQAICTVNSIDGVPMPMPSTKAGVKQLSDRIGFEGITAVRELIFPRPQEGTAATPTGVDAGTAKN